MAASYERAYPRLFGLDQLLRGHLAATCLPLASLIELSDHLLISMLFSLLRATCLFGRYEVEVIVRVK